VIDLGPDRDDKVGQIVVVGTPETVAENPPVVRANPQAIAGAASVRGPGSHRWGSECALVELGEGLGVAWLVAWIWEGVEGLGGDWRSRRQNGVCLAIRT